MVQKNAIKIWDVDVGNIVNLKLIETIVKYSIGYLDEVIRPSVLTLCEMSGYVKTFKDNNKLMSLRIDDEKL